MTVDGTQVLQSRDFDLFMQAYTSANALPADSAAQTSPGGSWVSVGATDGGVDVRIQYTYADTHVDQNVFPLFTVGTAGDLHFVTVLAQLTPQNLQKVTGQGTLNTVAAGSGTRGHTDLTVDGTIAVNYWSTLLQVKNATGDSEDIRILLRRAIAKSSPQPKFVATAKAALALDLQGYPDSNNANQIMVWRDVIAALP